MQQDVDLSIHLAHSTMTCLHSLPRKEAGFMSDES